MVKFDVMHWAKRDPIHNRCRKPTFWVFKAEDLQRTVTFKRTVEIPQDTIHLWNKADCSENFLGHTGVP